MVGLHYLKFAVGRLAITNLCTTITCRRRRTDLRKTLAAAYASWSGIGASIEGVEMASINSVPFGGGRVETSSNTKAKGGAPLSDILAPARTNGDEGGSAIGTDGRRGEDDTCVDGGRPCAIAAEVESVVLM